MACAHDTICWACREFSIFSIFILFIVDYNAKNNQHIHAKNLAKTYKSFKVKFGTQFTLLIIMFILLSLPHEGS